MTPSELMDRAIEVGACIGKSTLSRWVRENLVSAPYRKALGRGRGSVSEYPETALAEAIVAWWWLRQLGHSVESLRRARLEALSFLRRQIELTRIGAHSSDWGRWLCLYAKALKKVPLDVPVDVTPYVTADGAIDFAIMIRSLENRYQGGRLVPNLIADRLRYERAPVVTEN